MTALQALLSTKLRLLANGWPLFEVSPGEAMRLEDDVLKIGLGSSPFASREDGLVGFSGLRFRPSLIYAPNRKVAASAYSWVDKKTGGWLSKAIAASVAAYFWLSLTKGFNFSPMTSLQLCSNAYGLSLGGISTGDKISELRNQLRGNLRSTSRNSQLRSYDSLMKIFESANSEVKVARVFSNLGYDVELGIRPDVLVNGIGVEVKNVLWSFEGTPRYIDQLRQRAQEIARAQNAKIVIFDAGQYFDFNWHNYMRPLSNVMTQAIWRARKGRITPILLSYSPLDHNPRAFIL